MEGNKIITKHPILEKKYTDEVSFFYGERKLTAPSGVTIAAALISNDIHIMGRHAKDNLPQGIFCANGQCAQCLVIADGVPVKSCITKLKEGMKVEPLIGKLKIEKFNKNIDFDNPIEFECDVVIVGGGPAGMQAALLLADYDLNIILIDDKDELGGKLTLQTHQFFGSIKDCYAGTRGIDIAKNLKEEISKKNNIRVLLNSTAVAVFEDKTIGVISPDDYFIVKPKVLLNATGAREKMLHFPGSYLPNIYGAGAFQTLVNKEMIKPADKILIVGGGNVGLIAAYHALQADIDVIAVLEALPNVSGYKVHKDKIVRLGVPVLTSHTIVAAYGADKVEYAEFARVDEKFNIIEGSNKIVEVDAILIGVGLTPIDELSRKAEQVGLKHYSAGDALEISEASAAFFGGKIAANKILKEFGYSQIDESAWYKKMEILKSRPGKTFENNYPEHVENKYTPVLHCFQEIPCNPCKTACPKGVIYIPEDNLLEIPQITNNNCIGCFRCVSICPGLAITLVMNENGKFFTFIPYELSLHRIKIDDKVKLTDYEGNIIGEGIIKAINNRPPDRKRNILKIEVKEEKIAIKAAGIRLFDSDVKPVDIDKTKYSYNPEFVCRCEHITRQEIEEMIEEGITDINLMKAVKRVTMGACGGKSCNENIPKIMIKKGVPKEKIRTNTLRPFLMEIKLKDFAHLKKEDSNDL